MKKIFTVFILFICSGMFALTQAQVNQTLQHANFETTSQNSSVTIDNQTSVLNNITITQNTSLELLAGNTVACAAEGPPQTTGIQSFYRVFDLSNYPEINDSFKINTFGLFIQSVSTDFPVTVKIHTLEGSFVLQNMTEVASQQVTVNQNAGGSSINVNFSEPAVVSQNAVIVAEVLYSNGTDFGGALFLASNSAGQAGPTYIRSEPCQIPQPTSMASIGFPNVHWIMTLTGELFSAPDLGFFSLISPADNTVLTLEPDNNTLVNISWEASENASSYNFVAIESSINDLNDSNALSLLSDFSGSAALLRLPNSFFYSTLIDRGYEHGDQVNMIWSVAASGFGSTLFADETFNITFQLGEATNIENENNPFSFELAQNYPNPFNPTTNINFTLPYSSDVTLEVFNMQGQKVATLVNSTMNVGSHTVPFNAENLSSGIYMYRLTAGSFSQTNKMMLVK